MSKRILLFLVIIIQKHLLNSKIRDTFIQEAKKLGHEIDLINLHEEKILSFLTVRLLVIRFLTTEKD